MNQALEDLKNLTNIPDFEERITEEEYRYTTDRLEVMQINVGRLCNLACKDRGYGPESDGSLS